MNVLIVPSWYPNKVNNLSGSFFKEQAEALVKAGMNVTVFALNPLDVKSVIFHPIKSELFHIHNEIVNGVNTFLINIPTFGLNWINMFDYFYLFLFKLYFEIVKNKIGKFDIIHAHSYKFAGYAICKLFPNYSKIVTEHTSNIIINNLSIKDIRLLKYVLDNVDSFISVSNSLRRSIVKLTNTKKDILVIPNIVSNIFYYNSDSKVSDCFEFVSVSNLVSGKKVDILIKAFHLAFNNIDNVVLKIAGDGPERKKIESLIKQFNLEKKIKLLGQLDRQSILRLYQQANAFVMVSAFETFGVVYAESLMCGLPSIGTKNGGAEDILNCYGGYLCEVNDIYDIAKKMQYVLEHYNLIDRKKISENAYSRYSQFHIIKILENVYRNNLQVEEGYLNCYR